MKNPLHRTSLLVSLGSAFIMLPMVGSGASSNSNTVLSGSIRGNLAPEVRCTSKTSYDIDNNMAIVSNIPFRQASRDLGRIFLFDQPSTLSSYPIVPTGRDP